jgi:SAM-dependent methyltransferase
MSKVTPLSELSADLHDLQERDCPICGPSEWTVHANSTVEFSKFNPLTYSSRKPPEAMHFRFLRCSSCTLIFASPVVNFEQISALYRHADFSSSVESLQAARTYARLLDRAMAVTQHVRSGSRSTLKILDVGAGDGAFLSVLRERGFKEVNGVEPSLAPIRAAPPSVRELIINESFRENLFPEETFDIVTCFQTIEHVDSPLATVREIFRILRPGGMCVIVCHNVNAFSARMMGTKSPIYDVEHLQLFSRSSIGELLERGRLQIALVSPIINSYSLDYWLKLSPIPKGVRSLLSIMLKYTLFSKVCVPLPAGNLLAVGTKVVTDHD